MRTILFSALLMLTGCRGCTSGTGGVTTEPVRVSGPLRFADTYVGAERQLELELDNPSRVTQIVALRVEAPFALAAETVVLRGGSSERVGVMFRPVSAGQVEADITLGERSVEVSGLGLEVPECLPTKGCESASFDTQLAQCLRAAQPDGTACVEPCVMAGQCQAGACVGAAVDCSDDDACTVDSCSGAGCRHTPLACPPPTDPCKVAACNATSGCSPLDADDGTLCGSDACTSANVSVCIAGQCVQRPRPVTARCTNTWVPLRLPDGSALAYDPVRSQLLTWFGGQTWLRDGTDWSQRFPPAPPPHGRPLSATDTRRNRVVAFIEGETWEWDGATWLFRAPVMAGPGSRIGPTLAYDPLRNVTVLFGGRDSTGPRADTWEWNGLRWQLRTVAHAPSARFGASMAWDPSRSRLLLFAGTVDYFVGSSDTWEFDGTDWVARTFSPSPPPRYDASLTWDPVRSVFVVVAGTAWDPLDDIWELDASGWSARGRTPTRMTSHGAVWDPRISRVVVLDHGVTYAFDGQTLVPTGRTVPVPRQLPSVAFDPLRERITLYGGYPTFSAPPLFPSANDTWVRDTSGWRELRPATAPVARYGAALTWDPDGQRLVLFGGSSEINSFGGVVGQRFADTWVFDGTAWSQLSPAISPPAGIALGTWDEGTRRVVVVVAGTTWSFDGTTWSSVALGGPPWDGALAYDPRAHRLMGIWGNETMAMVNGAWELLTPATPLPTTSSRRRLTWDPSRQRMLLQGDDTFTWDGTDWTQLLPTAQPFSTVESLVFDPAAGRPVAITRSGEWTLLP